MRSAALLGLLALAATAAAQTNCVFTGTDAGTTYTWDLSEISKGPNDGYNVTVASKTASVNFCRGARCPCLSAASAICDCESQAVDFGTLNTIKASPVANSFGKGLILHYDVTPAEAYHHTFVYLVCDESENGLRTLFTNTVGDGHGGISFGFATKAACGSRGAPIPEHSCKAYGCGAFSRDHACQCDSNCTANMDCCSDFNPTCKGRTSCDGRCHQHWDPQDTCQCNDDCFAYNNCCSDFDKLCKATDTSCVGRCSDPWQPEDRCQCNSVCEQYGNCCSDYESVCRQHQDNCVGRCGTWSPEFQCQCNEACTQYRNCCPDKVSQCGN